VWEPVSPLLAQELPELLQLREQLVVFALVVLVRE
jgi:hypothetical protein